MAHKLSRNQLSGLDQLLVMPQERSFRLGAIAGGKGRRGHRNVATLGGVLADGALLELIRPNHKSLSPSLLLWDGHKAVVGTRIPYKNRIYTPAVIDQHMLNVLGLPRGERPYKSTRSLLTGIRELLMELGVLTEASAMLAAYFVLATHVADWLPMAPSVLVTGVPCVATAQFMRVLAALCRHSLALSGIRYTGFANDLRPTLILWQPDRLDTARRLLEVSQFRDFGVLDGPKMKNEFCAKAIFVGLKHPRGSWVDGSLQIRLRPPRKAILWDEVKQREMFCNIQARALNYRLVNHDRVANSAFDAPEFAGPARDLVRCFGACAVGDRHLQDELLQSLRAEDEIFRMARANQPESVIVEALLVVCHENKQRVHVGEIARLANQIALGRGENEQLNAKEVGTILKSLGVVTKRDAAGYGFRLSDETCRVVHELGWGLDVAALRRGLDKCRHCASKAVHRNATTQ